MCLALFSVFLNVANTINVSASSEEASTQTLNWLKHQLGWLKHLLVGLKHLLGWLKHFKLS